MMRDAMIPELEFRHRLRDFSHRMWVEPKKTAGLASSLLWQTEHEIGGVGSEAARWAFEFQRHRLANAGALAGMRKRLEGGGMCGESSPTRSPMAFVSFARKPILLVEKVF
jgi:hypothetical protein